MSSVKSFSPQSPSDLVAEFEVSVPAQVDRVVASVRRGQHEWWALGAAGRSQALAAAASDLRSRRDEATALVIREVGKPAGEAGGEVMRAISILDYYAQACFAAVGRMYPPSLGGLLFSERRPVGVATLITPWNFPLAIPLWKAAPALACGNGVVLKPSPDAAACAEFLRTILGAHLPDACLQRRPRKAETGKAVVAAGDVVSFTGSDRVGRLVAAQAGARAIPAQCEMGGQNAAIVFDDADPATTAAQVTSAAMGYAGQKCTATRRVIVVGSHPDFEEALVDAVSGLHAAPPERPETTVGPVITEAAQDRVLAAVEGARSAGGRVLAGGDREADLATAGSSARPCSTASPPSMTWPRRRPLVRWLTLHRARDAQAAAEMANGVRFGLVTSLHGRDLNRLLAALDTIDTGLIKVNAPTTGVDFYAPFGGEKDSSYGPREQGPDALDFYSTTRTVSIAPPGP